MIPSILLLCSLISPIPAMPLQRRQGPEPFVLPVPAEGPGPTFDTGATRAATNVQIRSAADPTVCFDVSNFRAGDFRFNLVPLALKPCDASVDGQKFDLVTKGEHNNVQDGSRTLIVSSQQLTCVDRRGNKNDRSRPGLFACGGRAVGDGETTPDQQFFFNSTVSSSGGIGFPIARDAQNNGVGPGNTCLAFDRDGFVRNCPCTPPFFTPEQTWIVGEAPINESTPQVPETSLPESSALIEASASECPDAPAPLETVFVTVTVAPEGGVSPTSEVLSSSPPTDGAASTDAPTTTLPTSSIDPATAPSVPTNQPAEDFVLPQPAEGPGPTFDASATRAATNAQIRNAADPSLCLDVSKFRAGDFRFNLVPLALQPCDAARAGQKFDLVTKGEHNDVADESRVIVVSSQQLTCIDRRGNKNDRSRPGLFACGGRAVGDGGTSFDQQFFFDKGAELEKGVGLTYIRDAPTNGGVGEGNLCLALGKDGFASNVPCAPPNLTAEQTWIVG